MNEKKKLKNCTLCLLRNNCRLRLIVKENEYVFKATFGFKDVYRYSESYNSIANYCKLYVLDDIKELSLPRID